MKKLLSFVLLLALVPCLAGCGKESASIGIIGGADGPTAVLVSSDASQLLFFVLIGMLVAAAAVIFVIYRNKKKK